MQGISSSPSDMGSTGIDSCKVIEEASPESPEGTSKENKIDLTKMFIKCKAVFAVA